MRRILVALFIGCVALSIGACKSPPPHTDSTKGTTDRERDTGMHDSSL